MTSPQPKDLAGVQTLEIMSQAPRYNRWQYSRIARYVGRRVCEIGSGVGNMSTLIPSDSVDLTVLTDTDPYYRTKLRERFAHRNDVVVEDLTLPDPTARDRFRGFRVDTVIALNVIEHIQQDIAAMETIRSILVPQGRFIVLVPAMQWLYGSLDRELGHARRYSRHELKSRMEAAGFQVERTFYFNLVGMIGWFMNARMTRAPRIPSNQLRWFDALVPLLRIEDALPLPVGQSVIGVGVA